MSSTRVEGAIILIFQESSIMCRRNVLTIVAVAVFAVFVLTFTPIPITDYPLEGAEEAVWQGMILLATVLTGMGWLRRRLKARRPKFAPSRP